MILYNDAHQSRFHIIRLLLELTTSNGRLYAHVMWTPELRVWENEDSVALDAPIWVPQN